MIGSTARLGGGPCISTLFEVPRAPSGAAARLELVAPARASRRRCRRLHAQPSAPSSIRQSTPTWLGLGFGFGFGLGFGLGFGFGFGLGFGLGLGFGMGLRFG